MFGFGKKNRNKAKIPAVELQSTGDFVELQPMSDNVEDDWTKLEQPEAEEEKAPTAEEKARMEAEERAKQHRAMKMREKARSHAEGGTNMVLFLIHRSNNTNSIVYKGDPNKGVTVLWMMFEKGDPAPTEGLTYAEKKTAYGFKCKPIEGQSSQWTLEMTALNDRRLFISYEGGVWIARTRINGVERVQLYAVHVEMKKSTFLPAVDYIEIFGEGGAYERKQA
jgi:hypothetical protein